MDDMLGEVPQKPHRKKGNPKAEPDSAVAECIDLFYKLHIRKWSSPHDVAAWEADPASVPRERLVTPRVNGGKHGRRFKELLASWGRDTTIETVRLFFATTDPRITNSDYTYDAFFARADYLRLQSVRRERLNPRTQRNIDAASRAAGRE